MIANQPRYGTLPHRGACEEIKLEEEEKSETLSGLPGIMGCGLSRPVSFIRASG